MLARAGHGGRPSVFAFHSSHRRSDTKNTFLPSHCPACALLKETAWDWRGDCLFAQTSQMDSVMLFPIAFDRAGGLLAANAFISDMASLGMGLPGIPC